MPLFELAFQGVFLPNRAEEELLVEGEELGAELRRQARRRDVVAVVLHDVEHPRIPHRVLARHLEGVGEGGELALGARCQPQLPQDLLEVLLALSSSPALLEVLVGDGHMLQHPLLPRPTELLYLAVTELGVGHRVLDLDALHLVAIHELAVEEADALAEHARAREELRALSRFDRLELHRRPHRLPNLKLLEVLGGERSVVEFRAPERRVLVGRLRHEVRHLCREPPDDFPSDDLGPGLVAPGLGNLEADLAVDVD
mmetsp:Transcript_64659/g.154374  ORF Transcript_64659/g.154374 Transcript_64659/m.154374 type:complete len:257 (-) Transcript_64659:218-988(-)